MNKELNSTINSLHLLLKNDMDRVNAGIIKNMESSIPVIVDLAKYLISSGGKRLRPTLTLASAKACGYEKGERHINLAQCVEFIHTSTLLHDDVIDESKTRRGKDTANSIWGNKTSVLVGDFLFSRSFSLMVSDGSLEVLKVLSDASVIIAEGEVLQLLITRNVNTTIDEYMKVIHDKTAALFSAATQMGPLVSGKTQYLEMMKTYGTELGLAFQMIDDLLDYSADSKEIGKNVGDDFREGKITLPVVIAIASGKNMDFWERTIGNLEQKKGDFEEAKAILQECNAFEKTMEIAMKSAQRARESIEGLPASEYKTLMQDLAIASVHRRF